MLFSCEPPHHMEEADLDETPESQPATLQDLIELEEMILAAEGVLDRVRASGRHARPAIAIAATRWLERRAVLSALKASDNETYR